MSGLPDQEPQTESSNSNQITLSAEQLNAIITNAVVAALQTAQSTQPQVTMPEIPKLITAQGLGTGAPKIGKSFVPKPEGFDGSQKKFETWWRNITLHIVGFEAAPNSHQKILIILSTMTEGSAAAFANNFMRSHGLRLSYYGFEEFTRMLAMHFAPADIKRKAQTALAIIKQHAHESVEAFMIRFNQCIAEAQIDKEHAGTWLVQIIRRAVKPEVVDYVEISQTHMVENENIDEWLVTLIRADRILSEKAERQRVSTAPTEGPSKNRSWNPAQGYISPNYKGKKPIANFLANRSRAPAPNSSATPAASMATNQPGLNQAGTFGAQGGIPMDISKACAEGKCARCGKPWPCAEHMRPRRIREMTFRGHQIRYTNSDELATEIQRIEKDFPSEGK